MTQPFDELAAFITSQMRMSHVYQPVMLLELLKNGGEADVNAIAKSLLAIDCSMLRGAPMRL